MADAKICDRCKEFYKDEDFSDMPYEVRENNETQKDLCKECRYELEAFMDEFPGRKGKRKKRGKYNISPEQREAVAERGRNRTDIAKLLQAASGDMTWNEAIKKATIRIKKAKEQDVTIEALKEGIERSTAYNRDRGKKKALCSMCGKNKVESEGDLCEKCETEWDAYNQNKEAEVI